VLVGCEFTDTVSAAFRELGHDVTSCDIIPSENPAARHHLGDVREIMDDGYTLGIFHPVCTYLTCSAEWAYSDNIKRKLKPGGIYGAARRVKRAEALDFTAQLFGAKVGRLCLENSKGVITKRLGGRGFWHGKPQMIQPHEYGHDVSKQTMLYLRDLEPLVPDPAEYIEPRIIKYKGKWVRRWANQSPCGADSRGPSADRGKDRSRFFPGVARAMAAHWAPVPC
jgi:hypothetical protein